MKRIEWNPTQRQQLANRAFEHRSRGMSKLDAIRMAQSEVLPPELHRNIVTFTMVASWVEPIWDTLQHNAVYANSRINPVEMPTPQPSMDRPPITDIPTQDLMIELMRRVSTALDPENIAKMVRKEVNACFERVLPGQFNPEVLEPEVQPETKTEPRARLPRVLIIGLLPGQQQVIDTKYKGVLQLTHIEGNKSGTMIRNAALQHDLTVKTQWSNSFKMDNVPNFHNISGGMSSITRFIDLTFKLGDYAA